ncbi:MAG: hypothetical protein M3535_10575 [Actinomycetota bacterium]|nr:hypothetical protein [Actinomycetota bacterium]
MMSSLSSLLGAITAKAAAAGVAGALVAGGLGVAAAQTDSGETDAPEVTEVVDADESIELPVVDDGAEVLPEVDLEPVDDLVGGADDGLVDDGEVDDGLVDDGEVDDGLVDDGEVDDDGDGEDSQPQDNFGARVSADARGEDGERGVDGQQIAAEARAKGQANAGDESEDDDSDESEDDESEDDAQVSAGARGRSGR